MDTRTFRWGCVLVLPIIVRIKSKPGNYVEISRYDPTIAGSITARLSAITEVVSNGADGYLMKSRSSSVFSAAIYWLPFFFSYPIVGERTLQALQYSLLLTLYAIFLSPSATPICG